MKKRLLIPYGMGEAILTEQDIRDAQRSNTLSTKEGRIIDAVLSYFACNCLTTDKYYGERRFVELSKL